MATRTTVNLVDDLDGTTAEETVRFGLEGGEYEIDLSTANATALRDTLTAYIAAARRSGGRRTTSTRTSSTRPAPAAAASSAAPTRTREENQQIRTWALKHGAFVPDRGRIPGLMVAAYEAGDPSMLPVAADSSEQAAQSSAQPAASGEQPAATSAAAVATPNTDAGEQPRGRDGLTATEREAIRAWAIGEGIEVKTRGQLKKELIANYQAVSNRR